MPNNKTLGQIAYEAASKPDHDPIPWDDPLNKDLGFHVDWEAAAQAVRRAVIDECTQSVSQSSWKHEGDDAYSKGMDQGARHQVDACIEALLSLKGETDDAN